MENIDVSQANQQVPINENFTTLEHQQVYGKRPSTSTALTWGYWGGRWGGFSVAGGTLTLTNSATNYIVAKRSDGVISVSTSNTNWNNLADYARVYLVVTSGGVVSGTPEDRRAGPDGVHGYPTVSASNIQCIPIAVSDEVTPLTTGVAKVTFRMPYGFTLTAVRSSATTAPTGASFIIDINQNGSSILSTKLSIDATEKTSTTAATPAVISDTTLDDDAEMTVDFDQVGSTIAGAGAKLYLIGTKT